MAGRRGESIALKGRGELVDTNGRRFLRGCYSERDELYSRIRMLQRGVRERRVADAAVATATSAGA